MLQDLSLDGYGLLHIMFSDFTILALFYDNSIPKKTLVMKYILCTFGMWNLNVVFFINFGFTFYHAIFKKKLLNLLCFSDVDVCHAATEASG